MKYEKPWVEITVFDEVYTSLEVASEWNEEKIPYTEDEVEGIKMLY